MASPSSSASLTSSNKTSMPIGKTSKAWLYFSTKDDPKSQKAMCSLCEKEVACSGETENVEKLLYLHNNLPKLNLEYERMSDDN